MLMQLPKELLFSICQYLDVDGIRNLCLVCRTLSPVFHDALFQSIPACGQPPLWRAIAHGNVKIAAKIIARSKPDVNAVYQGRTALCVALQRCDKIAIDFLLQQSTIDLNLPCFSEPDMLMSVAEKGDLGLMERLLRFPTIDINCQDFWGMTPAMCALVSGEFCILQLFLLDDRMNTNITNIFGETLLHLAVQKNDSVSIQMLVRHVQVDVNCRDSTGQTPLHLASQTRRHESGRAALSLLDSAKVDINARDDHDRTPLWYAIKSHRDDVVRIILQRPIVDFSGDRDSVTPLSLAVQQGRENIVKQILSHPKFSISAADRCENSLMWEACHSGNENLVSELLRWNVIDVNQVSSTGTSPLQEAIIGQHVSVVRLLLGQEGRVAVNYRGPRDWSALTFAAAAGHGEIVNLLLKCPQTDANNSDDLGRRPLWWALDGSHLEVIDLLCRDPRVKKGHRLRELRG